MLLKNTFAFLYFPSPNQITSYKTAIDFGMESHLVNKLVHHAIYWHQIDLIMTMTMIDQSNINPMKAYFLEQNSQFIIFLRHLIFSTDIWLSYLRFI